MPKSERWTCSPESSRGSPLARQRPADEKTFTAARGSSARSSSRYASSSERGAFNSVITAELVTATRQYKVAGTFFGHEMARLVQIGDYRLDAYLDGVLLVFTHRDVPGIIGKVGTIFGQQLVNIAQMAVGRAKPGGDAIGVLNLDSRPPDAALAEVAAHPDVLSVNIIELPSSGELPAWLEC